MICQEATPPRHTKTGPSYPHRSHVSDSWALCMADQTSGPGFRDCRTCELVLVLNDKLAPKAYKSKNEFQGPQIIKIEQHECLPCCSFVKWLCHVHLDPAILLPHVMKICENGLGTQGSFLSQQCYGKSQTNSASQHGSYSSGVL